MAMNHTDTYLTLIYFLYSMILAGMCLLCRSFAADFVLVLHRAPDDREIQLSYIKSNWWGKTEQHLRLLDSDFAEAYWTGRSYDTRFKRQDTKVIDTFGFISYIKEKKYIQEINDFLKGQSKADLIRSGNEEPLLRIALLFFVGASAIFCSLGIFNTL